MEMLRITIEALNFRGEPVLQLNMGASNQISENALLFNIFKLLQIAGMYKAKICIPENFVKPDIDQDYPYGVACILEFDSQFLALSFIETVRSLNQ